MNAMAATRQAELRQWRMRLAADTAPRAARGRVRAAIAEWGVPVDPDIAAVLTSDLVTHVVDAKERARRGEPHAGDPDGWRAVAH